MFLSLVHGERKAIGEAREEKLKRAQQAQSGFFSRVLMVWVESMVVVFAFRFILLMSSGLG